MSRKWERLVKKNKKNTNKQRAKYGKTLVTETKDARERFKGRSWLLPAFLVLFSVFFMISFGGIYDEGMYWFTIISYMALGLIIYFLRRPFLTLGKNDISSRRFSGEKFVKAADIEHISLSPGYIVIKVKNTRTSWVFSRLLHRFETNDMTASLRQFAHNNGVPIKEDAI